MSQRCDIYTVFSQEGEVNSPSCNFARLSNEDSLLKKVHQQTSANSRNLKAYFHNGFPLSVNPRCFKTYYQKGFTLIELLIVILIISIVTSFAVLTIHVNQNKKLENLTNQLKNTLLLAEQEALLRPATLGFDISKQAFQFYEYHTQSDPEKAPWVSVSDSIFGLHRFPTDVQLTLKIKDKVVEDTHPQLIISGSDFTPFTIYVGKKGEKPLYKIVGEENGNIKSELAYEE